MRLGDAVLVRHNTYRPDDIATTREVNRDDDLRGDNPEWERRCQPLIAFMSKPRTLAEVRKWGGWYRETRTALRFGANLAEECLYWLERQGRAYRGGDRRWRCK